MKALLLGARKELGFLAFELPDVIELEPCIAVVDLDVGDEAAYLVLVRAAYRAGCGVLPVMDDEQALRTGRAFLRSSSEAWE